MKNIGHHKSKIFPLDFLDVFLLLNIEILKLFQTY